MSPQCTVVKLLQLRHNLDNYDNYCLHKIHVGIYIIMWYMGGFVGLAVLLLHTFCAFVYKFLFFRSLHYFSKLLHVSILEFFGLYIFLSLEAVVCTVCSV